MDVTISIVCEKPLTINRFIESSLLTTSENYIFDKESFLYLLKVLSNKCSYVFLHISEENIQNIQEYNFITIINIYRFKINMHNVNNENWVLLKFNQVETVEKLKKYIRPDYLITLSN